MTGSSPWPVASLLLLVACAGSSGAADASPEPPVADAAIIDCTGIAPMELGRCMVNMGTSECEGQLDEQGTFRVVDHGQSMPMVLGPQGAWMIVFAVRTEGIFPGDPSRPFGQESPQIEIQLIDERGAVIGRYRGRSAFGPDAEQESMLMNAGLFVVFEAAGAGFDGDTLKAVGMLTDKDGAQRCGELTFVADRA